MKEQYPSLTPYNYVFNSPINIIDPDGRAGFYYGYGTGAGAGYETGGLDKPNYASGSIIVYKGRESDGSNVTGSAVTGSIGGMLGGSFTKPGFVAGYWFTDFADMESPTNSVGINIFGITIEIIVSGDKSDLTLDDIKGIEISKDGQGLGLGCYATQNDTKIITQTKEENSNVDHDKDSENNKKDDQ